MPEVKEEAQIEAKIEALQQEKSALGLFKGKEKKALQEQIDGLISGDLKKRRRIGQQLSHLFSSRLILLTQELRKLTRN